MNAKSKRLFDRVTEVNDKALSKGSWKEGQVIAFYRLEMGLIPMAHYTGIRRLVFEKLFRRACRSYLKKYQ